MQSWGLGQIYLGTPTPAHGFLQPRLMGMPASRQFPTGEGQGAGVPPSSLSLCLLNLSVTDLTSLWVPGRQRGREWWWWLTESLQSWTLFTLDKSTKGRLTFHPFSSQSYQKNYELFSRWKVLVLQRGVTARELEPLWFFFPTVWSEWDHFTSPCVSKGCNVTSAPFFPHSPSPAACCSSALGPPAGVSGAKTEIQAWVPFILSKEETRWVNLRLSF